MHIEAKGLEESIKLSKAQVKYLEECFSTNAMLAVMTEISAEAIAEVRALTTKNIKEPRWKLTNPSVDTSAWRITKLTPVMVEFTNVSRIYSYLDRGTADHGPKTKKALFIPLKKSVALAYANGEFRVSKSIAGTALYVPSKVRKMKRAEPNASQKRLVWGRDYVLAKKVRGIQARNITEQAQRLVNMVFRARLKSYMEAIGLGLKSTPPPTRPPIAIVGGTASHGEQA